jgi:hypothetical protein
MDEGEQENMFEPIERFADYLHTAKGSFLIRPTVHGEPINDPEHGARVCPPTVTDDETTPGLRFVRDGDSVLVCAISVFVSTVVVDGSILLQRQSDGKWRTVAGTVYTYLPDIGTRTYTLGAPRDKYGSLEDAERIVLETATSII